MSVEQQQLNDENSLYRTVHTSPYHDNHWTVSIDGEIGYLKSFQNKCEAIDYGRETAILNRSEHWIHHSNGALMIRETYDEIFNKLENSFLEETVQENV